MGNDSEERQNAHDQRIITSQFLFSLGGMALTVLALFFTVTRPTVERLDQLRADVVELKATTKASDTNQDAIDVRLRRIETDLYQLRRDYTNDRKPPGTP